MIVSSRWKGFLGNSWFYSNFNRKEESIMTKHIKAIIFDWGDTLMRDLPFDGPMAYWEKVEVILGAKEALETVSKDYICCVASNAGASNNELLGIALNRVNLREHFQYLFTSRELGVAKPNLDFFSKILEYLNLQPEECIMVGNDYEKDIIPANKVGLHTILFTEEYSKKFFIHADFLISSMSNLSEVIYNFDTMNLSNLH